MWLKIQAVTGQIWQWLKPIVILFMTTVGKQLMESALRSVATAAAREGFSNSQKREAAFNQIKAEMVEAGFRIAESEINMALELAVVKMKNK